MKKVVKSFICQILIFVFAVLGFFAGACTTVHATELNSTFTVKFVIADSTGSYPGSSLNVSMQDIMGEASTDYEVKKAASWGNTTGNVPSISVKAPTTYKISVSGLEDGYKLIDHESNSDIESSFAATNNGEKTFTWDIVADNGESKPAVTNANATSNVVADNADAESAYKEFLDTASFIQNDDAWADFLKGYSLKSNIQCFGNMYSEYVDNGDKTKEEMYAEYEAMSDFDKFLWTTTYLFMADKIKKGLPQDLTYDAMLNNSACPVHGMGIGDLPKADEVIEAYEKLLKWQADYIAANGCPFNFINNRSYLEEMGVSKVDDTAQKERAENAKKENEEIQKAVEELKGEEKKKGIWDDTLDSLSSNLITILILFILLGGLGYVIYLKKKNNYTDDIHEKK